jgi:hypothetical protein
MDSVAQLQLEFLRTKGLAPTDRLLDVDCGNLAFGTLAARYLQSGSYWGLAREDNLVAQVRPVGDIRVVRDFDLSVLPRGLMFTWAFASRVLGGLERFDRVRCVRVVMRRLTPTGSFYATCPQDERFDLDHLAEESGCFVEPAKGWKGPGLMARFFWGQRP